MVLLMVVILMMVMMTMAQNDGHGDGILEPARGVEVMFAVSGHSQDMPFELLAPQHPPPPPLTLSLPAAPSPPHHLHRHHQPSGAFDDDDDDDLTTAMIKLFSAQDSGHCYVDMYFG